MDRSLYIAASQGQVDVVTQHMNQIEIQITTNCNTALHVAAQFGQLRCVKAIVVMCPSLFHPSLLHRVNVRGETPLHMAAREGYSDIVKALIGCTKKIDEQELESGLGGDQTKKMLRATNVDRDTALHMAVRNCLMKRNRNDYFDMVLERDNKNYLEVVRLLTQEDLEFGHPANNAKETPLYLAAERDRRDVVAVLLDTCKSPTYGGPGGKTALHAAALNDSESTGELIERLLQWKRDLIKEVDTNGWTPIHCAAWTGNAVGVRVLLETDKSVAYISTTTNNDGLETALHMAAAHGHVRVMEKLLSYNPDCWEMVNSRGQNVLHFALEMEDENAIKFIIKKPWSRHLINQKDKDGNTPLHQLISSDVQLQACSSLWNHNGADWNAFNNKNMTPIDLAILSTSEEDKTPTDAARYISDSFFWYQGRKKVRFSNALDATANLKRARTHEKEKTKQREKEIEEAKKKREKEIEEAKKKREKEREDGLKEEVPKLYQTFVIVAALITTITFAAAFAIPGGYNGNQGRDQGMAVLARSAAFKGFVITNTIAMVCSVATIFLCITAMLKSYSYDFGAKASVFKRYVAALALLLVAMFVLILVFITASFAVLAHSIALAVSTCIIAGISFIVYFLDLGSIRDFVRDIHDDKINRPWWL